MVELPDKDILDLYGSLMVEVKARLTATNIQLAATTKETNTAQIRFGAEFCYLQLRRITELVALGVLAAHNPLPEFRTKNLLKAWNPDDLMRQLGNLSKFAFPHRGGSFDMGRPDGGRQVVFSAQDFASGGPRDDICRIYNECSDKLHTGALRAVLKQREKVYSLEFIEESKDTLSDMLN